jgi:uncharacterized protein YjiS (DUF1127 family)
MDIFSYFREIRRRRRDVEALQSLDSRTLKDLGIGRCEIASVVYAGNADRRRNYVVE